MRRALVTLLCSVLALGGAASLSGCMIGRATVRATSAFFSSPRKVVKAKRPVGPDARLAVVWVGHSTVLVQLDDKVVLTDPFFTSTAGQFAKRLVEPGIDPKDLPPIDAVLVSHMHFDHLSLGSLSMIEPRVRALLLPRGGTAYLTGWFSFPAYELGTWQIWEKDGLRVTAVPVDHVGWRYAVDEPWTRSSYTGFLVEYNGLKVYFGGDTAYDQRVFVEAGQRYPGIDLALLPIAPIEPRDIMRRFYLDPHEAVQAFVDLGAKRMVPIHHDTIVNSTDRPGDALRELAIAERRWDLGDRVIAPLKVGERRVFIRAEPPPPSTPPPSDTSHPEPQRESEPAQDDDSFE
jgi:L-ascorbate metabolism protein UlaG (beta-lactamase superfamily)